MINEDTIKSILRWISKAENETMKKQEQYKKEDYANELTFARLRGSEVAYSNAKAFIEGLTGIKFEDINK